MPLSIRATTSADAATLYALMRELAEYEGQQAHLLADAASLAADASRYQALLAEIDGVAVGFVSYTLGYSIWWRGDCLALDDLYVTDAARGQGVGERLMRAVAEVCVQRGLAHARWTVETGNGGARRFYRRIGAQVREKGVCTWPQAAMAAALAD
ncbi:GNAT family N-acetyltransferase [Lysobacter silvisoli]|uniref:GNAT family N-acetyltransferase n=1 Tax=Lysobacter silvisoli TaxID=2293254 RepID=A0A371JWC6_9GAMM|nr:GNAT family N-acetyltransferase [Lysobacter silvisoli]RDZ25951.1 GNAT family N-acetyltransferase [Lysobacter silvisoli]